MTEGTRSKVSIVGVAVGAVLAGNVLLLLLAHGVQSFDAFAPKATITSQAVFAKQTPAQSAP